MLSINRGKLAMWLKKLKVKNEKIFQQLFFKGDTKLKKSYVKNWEWDRKVCRLIKLFQSLKHICTFVIKLKAIKC